MAMSKTAMVRKITFGLFAWSLLSVTPTFSQHTSGSPTSRQTELQDEKRIQFHHLVDVINIFSVIRKGDKLIETVDKTERARCKT
jgi:hypothetical protein